MRRTFFKKVGVKWYSKITEKKYEKTVFDFDDTKTIYSEKKTSELLKNYILTSSCRIPLVSKIGAPVLVHDPTGIAKFFAKRTYFKQYIAGEIFEETESVIDEIAKLNMKSMLDYGVETEYSLRGEELNKKMNQTTNVIKNSITFASKHPNVTNCVLKLTGFFPVELLERISEILLFVDEFPEFKDKLLPKILNFENYKQNKTPSFPISKETPPKPLNDEELETLDISLKRLFKIADESKLVNVPLLVDAEHSIYQGAIDALFMLLALNYNKDGQTLISNTYQMYLKDSFERLTLDHQYLTSRGIPFGTKLVRGAYMQYENLRVESLNLKINPIQNGIEKTHENYKRGVDFCLDNIENTHLVIASMNKQTVIDAVDGIHKRGYPKNHPKIVFAQLYGMGDFLSLSLAQNGFNLSKYLIFGPVRELMPFFSRRLLENSDVLSGSKQETDRLFKEIKRRLFN